MARYIRKDSKVYDFSCCKLCGTAYGGKQHNNHCPVTVCLACDTPQCLSNGLGSGQCSVCYVGLLPGWSGSKRTCSYAGCRQQAIARGKRKKNVCREHLQQNGIDKYIASVPDVLKRDWVLVND